MRTIHALTDAPNWPAPVVAASGDLLSVVQSVQGMFTYHFMRNALLAGTMVAVVAGVVGYFMVLRGESFAGHTLANIGFAGAAGAALFGVPVVVGLLSFGVLGALGVGVLEERTARTRRRNDVAVGAILSVALGLGVLFAYLSTAKASSIYAILFGSALGVSDAALGEIGLMAITTLLVLAVIARPLLFTSLDPAVATVRGAPVRLLNFGFLLLLALAVALAVQVVGVLLIFALLVAPAASAQRLTARPELGVALSVILALLSVWSGLIAAYFSSYPVGFYVTTFALVAYLAARLAQVIKRRRYQRGPRQAKSSSVPVQTQGAPV